MYFNFKPRSIWEIVLIFAIQILQWMIGLKIVFENVEELKILNEVEDNNLLELIS